MKKMMKLSLVAAVAVAGFSTSASAKAMEDAIKNVDLSGFVRYRYTQKDGQTGDTNQYKVVTFLKSKVNDSVTFKAKYLILGATKDATGDAIVGAGGAGKNALVQANFIFNVGGATVVAGKQGLATPFADPTTQQGTGVVAVYPVNSALTLAGGLYLNSNAKAGENGADLGANNIAAVAALGKVEMVKYALWYAKVSETDLRFVCLININTQSLYFMK